ncbi:Glutamine synthetase [Pseudomonas syringae pv. philadelphi]|uniref:Glutamine synthetase n=1 Tax=Pseudomonas syringae pv. philadelphi TaxID=251706 RepID=A0A3M3ZGI7_9PSED|nr:Glutamine synthetase [Pseudomonas syringae pv. philadelphi]
MENRLPGANAIPCLAMATSLAAGLHALENALEPYAPMQG